MASLARSYLAQAQERLRHAREALESGNYPYVVRQCQEAVELALKAALRLVGVEPPKWHDVGPVLRREAHRFPQWFAAEVEGLAHISRTLKNEREASMYGDEELGLPPEELYGRVDAEWALANTEKVVAIVKKLYQELSEEPHGTA